MSLGRTWAKLIVQADVCSRVHISDKISLKLFETIKST